MIDWSAYRCNNGCSGRRNRNQPANGTSNNRAKSATCAVLSVGGVLRHLLSRLPEQDGPCTVDEGLLLREGKAPRTAQQRAVPRFAAVA